MTDRHYCCYRFLKAVLGKRKKNIITKIFWKMEGRGEYSDNTHPFLYSTQISIHDQNQHFDDKANLHFSITEKRCANRSNSLRYYVLFAMSVYRGRGNKRKTTITTMTDSWLKQTKRTLKRDDPNGVVLDQFCILLQSPTWKNQLV